MNIEQFGDLSDLNHQLLEPRSAAISDTKIRVQGNTTFSQTLLQSNRVFNEKQSRWNFLDEEGRLYSFTDGHQNTEIRRVLPIASSSR